MKTIEYQEDLLTKAYRLARKWHKGQVDKGGTPYIEHVRHVSEQMDTTDGKIVGMLHDIVEDTLLTLDDLRIEGFTPLQIDAVDALTRRKDETYDAFIFRVSQNPLAKEVKIKDMLHNKQVERVPHADQKSIERLQKRYDKYLSILKDESSSWSYGFHSPDSTHEHWYKNT